MLFIDNIPILTTVEEVINDLKIEFANSNIRIFEKVNNRNSNYIITNSHKISSFSYGDIRE